MCYNRFCHIQRHQWITEDLLNPAEWFALTSPARREKVEVTKSDMFMAVSSVHFRWGLGGFGRGMSALFRPLKARSRTSPSVRYSGRTVGIKSDPSAGRLLLRGGSGKSPATAGVQDVHVYARPGGKVDKGKRRAVENDAPQPSSPGAVSNESSSPELDAVRRQRSEMGMLGHELEQRRAESSTSAADKHQLVTPVNPTPKLEDIMSIVTWRPTKYPTPTTSLTPLLANVHADGTSTFRSPTPRSRKALGDVGVPVGGGPARTVSTLEGALRPMEDLLGIYGPEGELTPLATAAALNNFKRASSWGQGDEAMDDMGMGMGIGRVGGDAGGDVVSVTSVGGELNQTVKLMGAGGVESLGSPVTVSPVSPVSPGLSASMSGSGSAGAGMNGDGAGGDGTRWDELEEGIRKWKDYRRKHHHRNASSSTLPWVESLDDVTFGVNAGDVDDNSPPSSDGRGVVGMGENGRRGQRRGQESRGELTMEWMDDNYSTPGGYYGSSMGPATQFWRHGPGGGSDRGRVWSDSSIMTRSGGSSGEGRGPVAGLSRVGASRNREREVVKRREGPLDKFLSGEDSDSDEDDYLGRRGSSDEGSDDYGEGKVRRYTIEDEGPEEEGECEECEDGVECESESEDEDEHLQPIIIKSKSKGKMPVRH